MPVDRAAWPETFTRLDSPKWQCTNCGHTVSLKEDGITDPQTAGSESAHSHEAWEPEWIMGRFVARYGCTNCQDPTFVTGTYGVEVARDWREQTETYFNRFRIGSIEPPPALIRLPAELPESILVELQRAFRLFWTDGAACANAIRGVVEVFLNEMRVRKTSGSRRNSDRLNLHQRIESFGKKNKELSDLLMAVKWIGNVGSHAKPVGRTTLLDGFDLLEHVLEEAFDEPRKRVASLAHAITRRKGRAKGA